MARLAATTPKGGADAAGAAGLLGTDSGDSGSSAAVTANAREAKSLGLHVTTFVCKKSLELISAQLRDSEEVCRDTVEHMLYAESLPEDRSVAPIFSVGGLEDLYVASGVYGTAQALADAWGLFDGDLSEQMTAKEYQDIYFERNGEKPAELRADPGVDSEELDLEDLDSDGQLIEKSDIFDDAPQAFRGGVPMSVVPDDGAWTEEAEAVAADGEQGASAVPVPRSSGTGKSNHTQPHRNRNARRRNALAEQRKREEEELFLKFLQAGGALGAFDSEVEEGGYDSADEYGGCGCRGDPFRDL